MTYNLFSGTLNPTQSIPIPSGRSLRPVKKGGFFLKRVFNEIYDSLQCNIQSILPNVQNTRHAMISYFSQKSLKLTPPDALISAQNAPKCVWRPVSAWNRWGANSAPPWPHIWIQGVLLLRGREGNAPNSVTRFWGIEAAEDRPKRAWCSG